jgi:hypothetical protein
LIRYFPSIYKDELLYSAFGRYYKDTGENSTKAVFLELYGNCNNTVSVVDFPSHLNSFHEQFGISDYYSTDDIISNFTMLPLYYPFLDTARQIYATENMKGHNGKGLYMKLGVMASNLKGLNHMKFCPECIRDDMLQYKVPYWHRSHNLEGVKVCYKHHILLRSHCPICNKPINTKDRYKLHALKLFCSCGHNLIEYEQDISLNKELLNHHINLSKTVYQILNSDIQDVNIEIIYENYSYRLTERDLLTLKGRVRQVELKKQFLSHYPEDFLKSIDLNFDHNDKYTWIEELLHKPQKASHPIKHILLLNFLNDSSNFDQYIHNNIISRPSFGQPPWPCLNPVADHYCKDVIDECIVTTCTDTRKPVGTFKCSCGFIYSRRGPDTNKNDKFKIGRIKSFGHIWEQALQTTIIESGGSLRSIASKMNADPSTIKKYAKKLNINFSWETKVDTMIEIKADKNQITSKEIDRNKVCITYANLITDYVSRQDDKPSKTMVRKLFSREYTYLYRHSPSLLNMALSNCNSQNANYINNRVNWCELDISLYSTVEREIENILSSSSSIRITLSRLGRNIGFQSLLEQHLNKLPRTKILIEKCTESIEQYQIRRVHALIRKMKTIGEEVTEWKFYRRAGLRTTCSIKVKSLIKSFFGE